MKKLFVMIGVGMGLAACSINPVTTIKTDNPQIQAEYLATIDGCRVWRFDDSRPVYVVTCPGSSTFRTEWYEGCGRSCTRRVEAITAKRED
jgi:hypothetical protein